MLPLVSHGEYADGTEKQVDGRQTVTVCGNSGWEIAYHFHPRQRQSRVWFFLPHFYLLTAFLFLTLFDVDLFHAESW